MDPGVPRSSFRTMISSRTISSRVRRLARPKTATLLLVETLDPPETRLKRAAGGAGLGIVRFQQAAGGAALAAPGQDTPAGPLFILGPAPAKSKKISLPWREFAPSASQLSFSSSMLEGRNDIRDRLILMTRVLSRNYWSDSVLSWS